MNIPPRGICARLSAVRHEHFGPRGKARFARELGIRPSTYHHYEWERTPPVEVLVRAARVTGTDLVWLLTGETAAESGPGPAEPGPEHSVVSRLQRLLQLRPELERSVAGFLSLLEEMADSFPEPQTPLSDEPPAASDRGLIPIVGGTAAGTAHYWRELTESGGVPEAERRLDELLQEHTRRAVHEAELLAAVPDAQPGRPVSLVQFSRPDELGLIEFLNCPDAKARYPQAVAWRVDGDSMAPRYRDGDLVLTSPDQAAVEGHPCVARQRGQIGVNCKIFRRDGPDVVLVPINEAYGAQRIRTDDLLWAWRVLYAVRLGGPR